MAQWVRAPHMGWMDTGRPTTSRKVKTPSYSNMLICAYCCNKLSKVSNWNTKTRFLILTCLTSFVLNGSLSHKSSLTYSPTQMQSCTHEYKQEFVINIWRRVSYSCILLYSKVLMQGQDVVVCDIWEAIKCQNHYLLSTLVTLGTAVFANDLQHWELSMEQQL